MLLLCNELSLASEPSKTCIGIPANSPSPVVTVCETQGEYTFLLVDRTLTYDKSDYQNKLRNLMETYARRHDLPDEFLFDGTVTMWLSVPEATPQDAHGRFVIKTADAHFLVSLPIELDVQDIEPDMVATLGTKSYPNYFGHRSGTILVKKAQDAPEAEFLDAVIRAGGIESIENYRDWTTFSTQPFMETRVISDLLADTTAKSLVANTQLNQIFEWLAWREAVLQFPTRFEQ